jgi:hypothetical protein
MDMVIVAMIPVSAGGVSLWKRNAPGCFIISTSTEHLDYSTTIIAEYVIVSKGSLE